MSLTTKIVQYGGERGYLAYPERAKTPLPGLLIFQEAWGVDPHIEDVTRRFASAGYAALAPDLFAVDGERHPDLTPERLLETQRFLNQSPSYFADAKARAEGLAGRPEAERARIEATLATMTGYIMNLPGLVPRLLAAARWLRQDCEMTRGAKLGAVGFCMGGGLVGQLACHDPELAAGVVFYGPAPAADLMAKITCPMLAFNGSLDARLMGQLPAYEANMKQAGARFESIVYPGAQHAFFNDSRPSYDAGAARDAFVRSLEHLRSAVAG